MRPARRGERNLQDSRGWPAPRCPAADSARLTDFENRGRQSEALADLVQDAALLPARLFVGGSQRDNDVVGREIPERILERNQRIVRPNLSLDLSVCFGQQAAKAFPLVPFVYLGVRDDDAIPPRAVIGPADQFAVQSLAPAHRVDAGGRFEGLG